MFGVIEVGYSASINTPDYVLEEDTSDIFKVTTNISGEGGFMYYGNLLNKNWIVNQDRYAINVYIANLYLGNFDMLSWSCLDKNGNAFSPN